MTQDRIKEVKAVYSAKNKMKHSKVSGAVNSSAYSSRPFFSGLIQKLEEKSRKL